jgi:chromosomal replication initiator protein
MLTVWPRCLERLEAELPAEDVHTWLKPLQADAREDRLTLYAPNAYVVDEVRARHLARIRQLADHFAGVAIQVHIEVGAMPRAILGVSA